MFSQVGPFSDEVQYSLIGHVPVNTTGIDRTNETLDAIFLEIPKGTEIPEGSTRIYAVSANQDGPMRDEMGVNTTFRDRMYPGYPFPINVSFTDKNLIGGVIEGNITFYAPGDETTITHYACYFSSKINSSLNISLETLIKHSEQIGRDIRAVGRTFNQANPSKYVVRVPNQTYSDPSIAASSHNAHLFCVSKHDSIVADLIIGNISRSSGSLDLNFGTDVVDKAVPSMMASGVTFDDEDIYAQQIKGRVVIEVALPSANSAAPYFFHQYGITYFRIYFAQGSTSIEPLGSKVFVDFEGVTTHNNASYYLYLNVGESTLIPANVDTLLVVSGNNDGEMAHGIKIALIGMLHVIISCSQL